MMNFRQPYSFVTDNIETSLTKISQLYEAELSLKCEFQRLERLYIIGSNRLLKSFLNNQSVFKKESSLFASNIKNELHLSDETIAKGFYVPSSYQESDLPLVLYYKLVDELNGKPVLISEFKMKPGEFLIVPESSEILCAISYQDSRIDDVIDLPDIFKWFSWKKNGYSFTDNDITKSDNIDLTPENRKLESGIHISLQKDIFHTDISDISCVMNKSCIFFQLSPFIPVEEHQAFRKAMKNSNLWLRRTGDIYTQLGMDVIEWSQQDDCPEIIKKVLKRFSDELLIKKLSKLSGIKLSELKEISGYKMLAGEFINNHTDGTYNNQLKLRLNWLVQNPKERTFDMRFWNPSESNGTVTLFKAIENAITVFIMGEKTPHDITPMPDLIEKDRINIVFTYG